MPPPMVQTTIQPTSVMLSKKPEGVNIPLTWTQLPGSASQLSAAVDGSLWVLSDGPAGPDKNIWHCQSGTWTSIGGLAEEIAIAPNGSLFAINSGGGIYSYTGGSWTGLAGGGSAITVLRTTRSS